MQMNTTTAATSAGNVSTLSPDQMVSPLGDGGLAGYVFEAVNTTTKALAGAAAEGVQRRFALNETAAATADDQKWTGVGLEWLRSLLGRREWTIPCVDVKVRL